MNDPAGESKNLDRKDLRSRMVSGYAWQGMTKGFVQASAWISTIWVARILAPEDYGIMAVAGVFTGFAARVSEMGLAEGLITQKNTDVETEESVLTIGVLLTVALYLILYFSAPALAAVYDIPEIEDVIRVGGLAMFLSISKSVPYALAMRDLDFRYRSLVQMSGQFTQVVVLVTMATLGFRYWSLVWAFIAGRFVIAVAYWPLYKRIPRLRLINSESIKVSKFGLKVTLNRLSFFLLYSTPSAIIGKVLGSSVLGYYNMAFQLAVMPLDKIASVFNEVTFPAIARVHPDKVDDARYLFLLTHRYLLLLVQPALIGLALVAPDLVPLLLTDRWSPVVPVLQVFCCLNVLRLSSMIYAPVLSGRDRPGLVLKVTMVGLLILPVSVYFGTGIGLAGVMIAWAVVQPILFTVALRFLMRTIDLSFKDFVASWIPATSGSLVMVINVSLVNFWMDNYDRTGRLGAAIAVGVISYLATIFIFHKEDVDKVKLTLQSILNRRGGKS